jgi:ATPase subunit of ABC transporter with duplicated ATPase domains
VRGDKVGDKLTAPATTLLKLLLGELKPSAGKINPVRAFNHMLHQHKAHLEDEKTVVENIGEATSP